MYEFLGDDALIRDVVGYEELYQISEDGHVYSKKTGKERSCYKNDKGYLCLHLCKNGKQTNKRLHRLLTEAFISNSENKEFVDHINRNRVDNRLENLRWCNINENSSNKSISSINTSGFVGIYKKTNTGRAYWCARVEFNKKQVLKYFPFTEEGFENAKKWRTEKSKELHGNFSPH